MGRVMEVPIGSSQRTWTWDRGCVRPALTRNSDQVLSATISLDVTHGVAHAHASGDRDKSRDEGQGAGPP